MKRFLSIVIALSLFIFNLSALGASYFPNSFWEPNDLYNLSVSSNDLQGIINYGIKTMDIVSGLDKTEEYYNVMASRSEKVAQAYEELGDYQNAVKYYQMHIPLADVKGWSDAVLHSKMKLQVLTPAFDVYTQTSNENNVFFNAKHEPKSGVLYGMTYDADPKIGDFIYSDIKKVYPNKNSMYLMYLDWPASPDNYKVCLQDAVENNIGVVFAVTTTSSMGDIENYADKVNYLVDFLGKSGATIYFRWANEMNVGSNGDSPSDYIKSYRYVADIAKKYSNIAMAWSPNDVGAIDRPFENYYPGNDYVDWIGVSCYTNKYFLGNKENNDINDTYFIMGAYASPVNRLKPIMDFIKSNGITKPVMISEGGVAHYMNFLKEDLSDWAYTQLERMYADVPMVYPNVKMINYFNNYRADEASNYALYMNKRLQDRFIELTSDPYYIKNIGESADYAYKEITGIYDANKAIPLYSYAYYPKSEENGIEYYLDGNAITYAQTIPYKVSLDLASIVDGKHKLTATAIFSGTNVMSKTFDIVKNGEKALIKPQGEIPQDVDLNSLILFVGKAEACAFGNNTYIDKNNREITPIIYNSRTLVPVRFLAEALSAKVEWEANSKTVTINKGNDKITMQIDSSIMYKNGDNIALDVPPMILNGRTLLPLRAIGEALGLNVAYYNGTIIMK